MSLRLLVPAALALMAAGCSNGSPIRPLVSNPTVEVASTETRSGYARIVWQVREGHGIDFQVQRRHAEQPWKLRATLTPNGSGLMRLEDDTVSSGEPYTYRVRVPATGGERWAGIVAVDVP